MDSLIEIEKQRRISIETEINDESHAARINNRNKTQEIFEAQKVKYILNFINYFRNWPVEIFMNQSRVVYHEKK